MAISGGNVSMVSFAQAMRRDDGGFGARLTTLETRQGALDDRRLALAARAYYTCWHEASFSDSLLATCGDIRRGEARPFRLCTQVSPQRWDAAHLYVVAMQRWLGASRPIPSGLDPAQLARIEGTLGLPRPERTALGHYALARLIHDLRQRASFARLAYPGLESATSTDAYSDYGEWHAMPDGSPYPEPDAPEALAWLARAGDGSVSEALTAGLMRETPPPCQHRYLRYLDIRLSSIGALSWRGAVPRDPHPRATWQAQAQEAQWALRAWLGDAAGAPPPGSLGGRLTEALGERTLGRAGFAGLLLDRQPDEVCYAWCLEAARGAGLLAGQALTDVA